MEERRLTRGNGRKRHDRLDSCRTHGGNGVPGIPGGVCRGADDRPRRRHGAGMAFRAPGHRGRTGGPDRARRDPRPRARGRKAVLRAAGAIPLHDEQSAFASATSALGRTGAATSSRWDTIAIVTSFKAVILEGIEVVFIVLAVGAAGHMIVPASLGAAGAGIGVALAALALRRPLARVPENTLKLSVGVLIGSFGAFWIGEGLGFRWPGADLAILGIAGAFLVVSLLTIAVLRRTRPETFGHLGRGNASSEDADRRPSITWASRSASGRAWTTSWPPRSRASTCRPTRTSSSGAPERRHRPVRGSVFTTSACAITMSGDSWSAAWYLGVNAPTSPERSNR